MLTAPSATSGPGLHAATDGLHAVPSVPQLAAELAEPCCALVVGDLRLVHQLHVGVQLRLRALNLVGQSVVLGCVLLGALAHLVLRGLQCVDAILPLLAAVARDAYSLAEQPNVAARALHGQDALDVAPSAGGRAHLSVDGRERLGEVARVTSELDG